MAAISEAAAAVMTVRIALVPTEVASSRYPKGQSANPMGAPCGGRAADLAQLDAARVLDEPDQAHRVASLVQPRAIECDAMAARGAEYRDREAPDRLRAGETEAGRRRSEARPQARRQLAHAAPPASLPVLGGGAYHRDLGDGRLTGLGRR